MPPLTGPIPVELTRALEEGLFRVPERPDPPPPLGTSAVQSTWHLPIVLAGFADQPLIYPPEEFEFALFDSTGSTPTGSVFDYYRWVSGGRLTVTGKVVAVVQLPREKAWYAWNSWGLSPSNTPNNAYGAVREALERTPANVNWSEFDQDGDGTVDMLWFVHAGIGGEASPDRNDLWSITSSMIAYWRNGTPFVTRDTLPSGNMVKIDRFTVLPELSAVVPGARSEIGVYCHEFGHALRLPDLYNTASFGTGNVGPGNWSLMSSGAYGANGLSPESPTHIGAWPSLFLGWHRSVRPAQDGEILLEPLAEGGPVVDWWFQGEASAEHFLIENRQRLGFDRNLPSEGLIIYHVDEAVMGLRLHSNTVNAGPTPGLIVVEADGKDDMLLGRNRGDGSDPFPGSLGRTEIDDRTVPSTRTFTGRVTQIAMRDLVRQDRAMRFFLQVRAPGWETPVTHQNTYQPVASFNSARVGAVNADGVAAVVASEFVSGRPQIVLRENQSGWSLPTVVSASSQAAVAPALAMLPGGDLAVVWSDTREGRSRLYYRSRILNQWTAERLLVDLPGDCHTPALTSDERGTLSLAFIHAKAGTSRVMFMRFTYFSPFGQPIAVTPVDLQPELPAVEADLDGGTYIGWVDRSSGVRRTWFSRYHPDSGVTWRHRIAPDSRFSEPAFGMVVGANGTLHTIWHVSGPGVNEIRYAKRPARGLAWPRDELVESHGEAIQNPSITSDLEGAMHLMFEASRAGVLQVRYRKWNEIDGWDARSTDVTSPTDGGAQRPVALPTRGGDLTVLYIGYSGARAMLRSRQRILVGHLLAAPQLWTPVGPKLRVSPNPLRAGTALSLVFEGAVANPSGVVDIFDASGRRVTSAHLSPSVQGWRGSLPAHQTVNWSPGVYFARPSSESASTRLVVIR